MNAPTSVQGIVADGARESNTRADPELTAHYGLFSLDRAAALGGKTCSGARISMENGRKTHAPLCKSLETKQTMPVCNETPGPS
jgi:hypothetical protein